MKRVTITMLFASLLVVKQSAYGGCRLSETRRTVSFDRRLKKHNRRTIYETEH